MTESVTTKRDENIASALRDSHTIAEVDVLQQHRPAKQRQQTQQQARIYRRGVVNVVRLCL